MFHVNPCFWSMPNKLAFHVNHHLMALQLPSLQPRGFATIYKSQEDAWASQDAATAIQDTCIAKQDNCTSGSVLTFTPDFG